MLAISAHAYGFGISGGGDARTIGKNVVRVASRRLMVDQAGRPRYLHRNSQDLAQTRRARLLRAPSIELTGICLRLILRPDYREFPIEDLFARTATQVLTREANQSLLILLAKIVRPSPNGNLGQRTNVSMSLPKRLLKLGPKQGN